MAPLPILASNPSEIPDDVKDLTQEIYAVLATDYATITRYARINHARCALPSTPADADAP